MQVPRFSPRISLIEMAPRPAPPAAAALAALPCPICHHRQRMGSTGNGSAVQASSGIQPQLSRFGLDEISAVAVAARFTCQYGSRNGSRPLTVRIINVATTICTSSSYSCIICNSFPICCMGLPATYILIKKKTRFNELR